ncbi:MAG: ATP-binding protein [Bacteroidales bacterium]|nr:ATP-binding protein [Bacteroidales bacterium]
MDKDKYLYNNVMEYSINEIYLFDAYTWRFVHANEAARNNLGYSMEELQTLTPLDLKPEHTQDTFAELLKYLHTGEKEKIIFETVQQRKNKSLYHVEVHLELLNFGLKPLFLAIILDLTERRKNERKQNEFRKNLENLVESRTQELEIQTEQLKKSQKAMIYLLEDVNMARKELQETNRALQLANEDLEAFSYSVSHDLKAPLRAIEGFLKIIMAKYSEYIDDEGKELFSLIFNNLSRMKELIDGLLQFSHIQRKKIIYSEINIEQIFKKVYDELSSDIDPRKYRFYMKKLPACKGNINLIERVITNILSNAIKYSDTDRKTIIEVSAKEKHNTIIYAVKDNGIGFDMKYADKIFNVFQRLHTVEEYQGTGIGLSLVKRIITKHGGKIWVESEKGKGTTFYFSLPAAISGNKALNN